MKDPATTLTRRELEIFRLIGRGDTARDIAVALDISKKTVEAHRENIKAKLGLPSAPALTRTAINYCIATSERNRLAEQVLNHLAHKWVDGWGLISRDDVIDEQGAYELSLGDAVSRIAELDGEGVSR